jgi:hypothetical protein
MMNVIAPGIQQLSDEEPEFAVAQHGNSLVPRNCHLVGDLAGGEHRAEALCGPPVEAIAVVSLTAWSICRCGS